ncbi:MAG: 2-amino-4-hydroxy-6-hydroxymethyldihydropteridine diphosphokinase [Actinomycetaceae bacterium]|nr:2-amino-4-hydroxy-6-hydroxymethyldihydropteridine diphosphokinase [Actinomycetaceae bacterium]
MSAPLDCISLTGVRAYGRHGVYDFEREEGQEFRADVDVFGYFARGSDNLTDTLDYSVLAKQVQEILVGAPHNLIEHVAEEIAGVALGHQVVQCVRVTVHKPDAPIEPASDDIAVTIWRGEEPRQTESDIAAAFAGEPVDGMPTKRVLHAKTRAQATALEHEPGRPVNVIVAFGSNLGEPVLTLRRAIHALAQVPGISLVAVAPLVRTAPVLSGNAPAQPDYFDTVVKLTSKLSPYELLAACQDIEQQFGRERPYRHAPRTLDIDIICVEGFYSEDPILTLPHPRAHERAFVLEPWRHLEPDAQLPGFGAVATLAEAAPDRGGIRAQWHNWIDVVDATIKAEDPSVTNHMPLPSWEAVVQTSSTRMAKNPVEDENAAILQAPAGVERQLENAQMAAAGTAENVRTAENAFSPREIADEDFTLERPAFVHARTQELPWWQRWMWWRKRKNAADAALSSSEYYQFADAWDCGACGVATPNSEDGSPALPRKTGDANWEALRQRLRQESTPPDKTQLPSSNPNAENMGHFPTVTKIGTETPGSSPVTRPAAAPLPAPTSSTTTPTNAVPTNAAEAASDAAGDAENDTEASDVAEKLHPLWLPVDTEAIPLDGNTGHDV